MNKLLYVAMSGAKTILTRQATNNHNLANLSTTGFREDLDAAKSFPMDDQTLPTRVFVDVEQSGINADRGTIINTGRDLDIAIQGEGLLAVLNPDGSESYTRAGNLRVGPDGLIETADGFAVVGNNGPIVVPPYETLEISEDGTISIQSPGDAGANLAVIDRIKLVNPDETQLAKNDNGLLELRPQLTKKTVITATPDGIETTTETGLDAADAIAPADGTVSIMSGALETSNVNPARSLVTMVELSRLFEMQMKMMKVAEENDAANNRLLT
ncbi:MAG: flagellar basal body rod protein FlgF [Gammaproteobacteria bacterium]|nr:flagellar basal body rod protein FlgF [Gammaproteobacteria bacterium]